MTESAKAREPLEDSCGLPSPATVHAHTCTQSRPLVSLASPSAFLLGICRRLLSLWTPSFVRSLIYGQVLSVALTSVSVFTTELVDRNWVLPSTQVFFPYATMCIMYTPYTIYKYGFRGWCKLTLYDGWKYFILTLGDFEAGYLFVKAYGYTDLMSCMLLDAWSIPVCMFVCWLAMHVRYHWTQVLGVLICIGGLALLVTSDLLTGKNGEATRRGEGDGFMLAAATLYGFVNAAEEFFVRRSPLYEVLGQMGLYGIIASSVQSSIIERKNWKTSTWDGATAGLLLGYTCSTVIMYTLQMMLFRIASSPYFNMSLLTSDFYSLLFGLFLFHYSPYWLYFVAFVVEILGLMVYFLHATPEDQGITNIELPRYLKDENKDSTGTAV